MSHFQASLLIVGPAALAVAAGLWLLRRACFRSRLLPEEVALAAAWVYIVGALVWLWVFLTGSSLFGFGDPWSWLAALHFTFAGFGSLTVTALTCRVVTHVRALQVLRVLLLLYPVVYLATAAGISGWRYGEELGALGYWLLFILQLCAYAMGCPKIRGRTLRALLAVALAIPVVTMLPAISWAWNRPVFDLFDMVRYHGVVNALGHVGLAFFVFTCCRPDAHSPLSPRFGDRAIKKL